MLGTISRRGAGIWFIWSLWLISSVWFFWFIWFDERERQDRPGNKNGIDYFSGVFRDRPRGRKVGTISDTDAIWASYSGEPTAREERHTRAIPLADGKSLLLIILDDLRWANLRFVRVKPDVAKGTTLAQEVPALIQFDLDLREPLTICFGVRPLLVQSVFLCDKVLNMIEDRLIFDLILHQSLLPRGCDRNGQALMLRPPETAVNRCSGQHDDPGVGCQDKENVPGLISRRVAGIWFIWFLRSVSCVWFAKRERPDRPAHQIYRL